MKLKEIIKKLRIENHMSQQELANELGVTRQTIVKWEKGKNIPDMTNLINISKVFNIPLNELISNQDVEINRKEIDENVLLILVVLALIVPYGSIGVIIAVYVKNKISNDNHNFIRFMCNISIIINMFKMIIKLILQFI